MHVRPPERPRAFRKIVTLLTPGGLFLLTLRNGPSEPGRVMHPISEGEIEVLARDHGLAVIRALQRPDAGVSWTTMCLRLPDDGTVGLPLIRGIILAVLLVDNDHSLEAIFAGMEWKRLRVQ